MEYGAFVVAQLLQEISPSHKDLAYDYLYSDAIKIYKDFEQSFYNDSNKSEYDCIHSYLLYIVNKKQKELQHMLDAVDDFISLWTSDIELQKRMREFASEDWIHTHYEL
jgi:hypothetical protein